MTNYIKIRIGRKFYSLRFLLFYYALTLYVHVTLWIDMRFLLFYYVLTLHTYILRFGLI